MSLLPRPDAVFPYYISRQLPTGIAGLVIAGLCAAAMDSNLNSLATLFLRIWLFALYLSSMESFFLDRAEPMWFTLLVAVFGLHYMARFRARA